MTWRSWTTTNRCPVCGGHQWAGRSADQCRGGQRDESPQGAYCSVKESSSPREKTWLWLLDRPYVWLPEGDADPTPIWQRAASRAPAELRHPAWAQTTAWDYQDEHGNYAYSVVRFDWRGDPIPGRTIDWRGDPIPGRTKDYRPGRRFTGAVRAGTGSDLYRWGLPAKARLPYNLPVISHCIQVGSNPIWIVEGEKSADALIALGCAATTMPGGSASWLVGEPSHWLPPDLVAHVVVDRDEAGLAWARDVRATLPHATFWQSAILNPGDDVVDHLVAGFTLAELILMELP